MEAENGQVLLVAGNATIGESLSRAIESQGNSVLVAHDGEQALALLGTHPVDLVLLDNTQPGLDGLALLARLKAHAAGATVPVLVLTTGEESADVEQALEGGAADYLPAPFNPVVLRARVAGQMAKKQLRAQAHDLLIKAKIEQDLEIGRRIQAGFLPDTLPQPTGWEVAAYFHPARQVAGDFYDGFMLAQNRRLGVVIADVCDKGVHAAMYMALIRSLIRAYGLQHYALSWMDSLESLATAAQRKAGERRVMPTTGTNALQNAVKLTNDYLNNNHRDNMFATFFFAVIDPFTGSLTYVNGGHNPPAIIAPDGTIKARLKPTGTPVGMMPGVEYATRQEQLEPGDTLFTFTDGVTDARAPNGQRFNEERLLPLLNEPAASAAELCKRVERSLWAHIDTADQFDDITMLAVRRAPAGDPGRE